MGKKVRQRNKNNDAKKDNPLLSTPVNSSREFEGLESFEELKTCTFLKRNKYGKIKRMVWENGKMIKKKNKEDKKSEESSTDAESDHGFTSEMEEQKSPKKKSKKMKTEKQTETSDVSKDKPQKRKRKKKKKKVDDDNDGGSVCKKAKKARYDNATYHGCNESGKEKVDVSAWEDIFTPPEVLEALAELGFSTPTEIQRLVLPAAIKGRMDIIGAAETGSGKTLAFGIPIIHGILSDKKREAERQNSGEDSGVEYSDQEVSEDEEQLSEEDVDFGQEDSESEEELCISPANSDGDGDDDDENSNDNESEDDCENTNKEFGSDLGCVKVIDNMDFDFLEEEMEVDRVTETPLRPLRALIVTPTRELAIQVKSHLASILRHTDIKLAVVIGGLASEKQARILNKGPDIVVGTPGRLWELIEYGNLHLNQLEKLRYLAIDETDRMVERGHFEELTQLLERINSNEAANVKRQNFVFSATLTLVHSAPKRSKLKHKTVQMTSELKVKQLSKIIGLKAKPKVVDVTRKFGTAESLTESRINCNKDEKDFFLYYFLKQYPGRTLVFCNSIDCVRRLQNLFTLLQCHPLSLHASMHQKQRLKSLEKFSSSSDVLLLATDVAARGLDIPNIQHVIHYQTPRTAETYIHRSGRTARATQEGLSVLLIDSTEMNKYRQLCTTLNRSTDLPPFPVDVNIMNQVKKRLNFARKLESMEHSHRKARAEENWLRKAAEEAELIIDEEESDEELIIEKDLKAVQQKREIKSMRTKLMKMLAVPLLSSNFSGKYPTQSGALITPFYNESRPVGASEGDSHALSVMKKESVAFSKLIKTVKHKAPVKKVNKKKFKGFEKRRLKLEKEKLKRQKEQESENQS